MPKVSTETESRVKKFYRFHGVLLDGEGSEGIAECPFCGKEKFHVALANEDGRFNCLSGDTRVLTRDGYKLIRDLVGKDVELLSHLGWTIAPIYSFGKQKLYKIKLIRDRSEKVIKATINHRWVLKNGKEVTTKSLVSGMRLASSVAPSVTTVDLEGIRHGIMYGDGSANHVNLYGPKIKLLKYLEYSTVVDLLPTENGVEGIRVNGQNPRYKKLPLISSSKEYLLGFLKGYFATDGTAFVQTCIDSKSKEALEFVREAAAIVGLITSPIASYWRKGIADYEGYLYRVAFHRSSLYPEFFLREDHQEAVVNSKSWGGDRRLSWRVVNVELSGEEEVYCASVEDAHTFTLDDNLLTGNCKVCGVSGNPIEFLRELHKQSFERTKSYEWIENHRGINKDILKAWGVCQSVSTMDWIVPGYGANGKLNQLYRYLREPGSDKYRLNATATMPVGVFGPMGCILNRDKLYICEGPWDGMVLWDALHGEVDVISVPGSNVFHEGWSNFTADKSVTLFFDNDHPDKQGRCAGFEGVKHAVGVMTAGDERPKDINYLYWGEQGYDESRPSGFDIRDAFDDDMSLEEVLAMVKPVPNEWIKTVDRKNQPPVIPINCESWNEVRNKWKLAAKWTPELDGALAVLLASVASVKSQGEQLWIKLISPPSTFKSKLCSAIGMAKKYIVEDDGMNGFYSGYIRKDKPGEDHSLANKLWDRTLITKEGATLVHSPMKDVIISQARSLYDSSVTKRYNNSLNWDYQGLRFTWILAGTQSLRVLDASELGQRFIDYVIMEEINSELESEILKRALHTQELASRVMSNCKAETTLDAKYLIAARTTVGYIHYLKKSVGSLVELVETPSKVIDKIEQYAVFVECMRARPSSSQEESSDRALATRVGGQLLKLAQYLAVVKQKKIVDKDCMKIVKKVAMDTARGRTLKIVDVLVESNGMDTQTVAQHTNQNSLKEAEYLRFMRKIRVVELYVPPGKPALRAKWRLTKDFERVYREVVKP